MNSVAIVTGASQGNQSAGLEGDSATNRERNHKVRTQVGVPNTDADLGPQT